jgi:phosphonate transport system permease protein
VTRPFGTRRRVVVAIVAAGLAAAWWLELRPSQLAPGEGGLELAGEFFAAALTPAWTYEADFVPDHVAPLPVRALLAATRTVLFAAAAVSISIVIGLLLGLLGSTAWWPDAARGRLWVRGSYGLVRALIVAMRSIHELLWAALFLSAMGLTPLAAVIAIAIPYSGTFAKIFSELIDEAPRDSALALRAAGATAPQVFCFGLFPRAFADLCSYACYRFECGLRSSAILGFFGIPTIGLSISLSFENLYYREVWSYLYVLFALVTLLEWWGIAVRRRLVA